MFDSLSDQIKHDERGSENRRQRVLVWTASGVLVALLFGAVYIATRLVG